MHLEIYTNLHFEHHILLMSVPSSHQFSFGAFQESQLPRMFYQQWCSAWLCGLWSCILAGNGGRPGHRVAGPLENQQLWIIEVNHQRKPCNLLGAVACCSEFHQDSLDDLAVTFPRPWILRWFQAVHGYRCAIQHGYLPVPFVEGKQCEQLGLGTWG